MRFPFVSSVLIASIALTRAASAQAPASPVQQRMREPMIAEERYYSDHGTYTTDISALGFMKQLAGRSRRSGSGFTTQVVPAGSPTPKGANGMSGSCVACVGDISNFASVPTTQGQHLKPTEEGVITCDP